MLERSPRTGFPSSSINRLQSWFRLRFPTNLCWKFGLTSQRKVYIDYSIVSLHFPQTFPLFSMRFLSIDLTLAKGIPKRAGTKTPPLRSRLGETCGRAHINKTHYDQTNKDVFISKCQGGTKSQPLPHCLAVAVRPEQSLVELHLHVFLLSGHFRDTEAHATG